jgi:hypothetical protein
MDRASPYLRTIDWAQLSRFYLSLRNVVLKNKQDGF